MEPNTIFLTLLDMAIFTGFITCLVLFGIAVFMEWKGAYGARNRGQEGARKEDAGNGAILALMRYAGQLRQDGRELDARKVTIFAASLRDMSGKGPGVPGWLKGYPITMGRGQDTETYGTCDKDREWNRYILAQSRNFTRNVER